MRFRHQLLWLLLLLYTMKRTPQLNSFFLCSLFRTPYADFQLNYTNTSNFMGWRVQNDHHVWPFLLLLFVFISFLIARLWFHYSFHRPAHYFSLIQLVRDTQCDSPRFISPPQQRAYAQIIEKNAFNGMYGMCFVVRHTHTTVQYTTPHCYYKWFYCWPLFLYVWL